MVNRSYAAANSAFAHGHKLGGKPSPTYQSWKNMKARCSPNYREKGWEAYVGVSVCERWTVFANFLADMGERPPGTSLDRYPNRKGNYEPGNCRWATPKEQSKNSAQPRLLSFDGRCLCVSEWARERGISKTTIASRLRDGWSAERAIATPPMSRSESARLSAKARLAKQV